VSHAFPDFNTDCNIDSMAQKEPPLDEQVWFADHLVSFYQGIHTNSGKLYQSEAIPGTAN
jgi:hypothetical protein